MLAIIITNFPDCAVIEVGFTQTAYSVSEAAGSFSDVMFGILVPADTAILDISVVISVSLGVVSGSAVGKSVSLYVGLPVSYLSLQKANTSVWTSALLLSCLISCQL